MSDYGDDDLDWANPNVLAELESLESNVSAAAPPRPPEAAAPVKARREQTALPRASQLPPKPAPAPAPVAAPIAAARGGAGPSRATTPALPSASQYGNARPGGILRPPRPPQRPPKPATGPPAAARLPALKQDLPSRASTSTTTRRLVEQPVVVDHNNDDEEEDLPEIRVNERHAAGGGSGDDGAAVGSMYRAEPQRGITVAHAPPRQPSSTKPTPRAQTPVPSAAAPVSRSEASENPPNAPAALAPLPPRLAPIPQIPRPTVGQTSPPPVLRPEINAAGGSGLTAQERAELEALRREKARVSLASFGPPPPSKRTRERI